MGWVVGVRMIDRWKETSWILGMLKHLLAQEEGMARARRKMIAGAMECREGSRSTHFHDNHARSEKPFRFSPPGLTGFSGPGGYLRVESSAENLDSHFLSFFGVVTMEVIFQPVLRDTECELRGGTSGTSSSVGGSIGTRDGAGAVDGRLRIGRRNLGEVLAFSLSDGWLGALGLRRVNVSFPTPALIGVEGELRARPADRGRTGVISCGFPFSCIVDGRFLPDAVPKFCRVSVRFVAVDGRRSGFRLLLLFCVAELVDVDSC